MEIAQQGMQIGAEAIPRILEESPRAASFSLSRGVFKGPFAAIRAEGEFAFLAILRRVHLKKGVRHSMVRFGSAPIWPSIEVDGPR